MKIKKTLLSFLLIMVVGILVGVSEASAAETPDDLIKKIAPDGKNATLKSVKPKDEMMAEFLLTAAVNKIFDTEEYEVYAYAKDANDLTDCCVVISNNDVSKEYDIKVTYDEPKANSVLNAFISNMKTISKSDIDNYYQLSDMSLINYYLTSEKSELWNTGAASRALKYSEDIIKLSQGGNISFVLDARAGNQDINLMYENAYGGMTVFYEGYVYETKEQGLHLKRIIYIPQNTADTKEAYIAAAQKRVNEYLGNDTQVKITYGGTLDSLPNDAEDESVPRNTTDGNYYNVTVKGKTYKFYLMKGAVEKLVAPVYVGSDLKTNISITSDKAEVPLDTHVTINKVENNNIKKALGTDVYEAYDITLFSDAKNAAITKLVNGMFKVSIPLSDKFKGKTVTVYYVDSAGKTKEYTAKPSGNMIVFETNHFSTYAITEKSSDGAAGGQTAGTSSNNKDDESKPSTMDETPKTGDSSKLLVYITLFGASLLAMIGLNRKVRI